MDKASALHSLKSEHTHERLRASRALVRLAQEDDWALIQAAYASETVPWIRRSLGIAMDRIRGKKGDSEPQVTSAVPDEDDFAAEVYSEAVEATASQILHQLAAPLGLARENARSEIPDYETSKTKKQLQRLSGLMEAIDTLQVSASPARPQRFDLGAEVETTAESCASALRGEFDIPQFRCPTLGPMPMWIYSDPGLIETALSNAVTNAIEAVIEAETQDDPNAVVITWGETDTDYWISVIDRGGGLPPNHQRAFEFGVSSKDGHYGAGLALSQQALCSLGGKVTLMPGGEQGCQLEITWPKERFTEPCES